MSREPRSGLREPGRKVGARWTSWVSAFGARVLYLGSGDEDSGVIVGCQQVGMKKYAHIFERFSNRGVFWRTGGMPSTE